MEQLQQGDIAELKSGGPKMTILSLDGSSGEAMCVWFEGKNRNEEIFDVAALRKVHQQKPRMPLYPRGR
jgi:uncharacterized protein YodC (DUF2158 family)